MNLESLLQSNHLINAFKNFTKIWGCHVMFPHHFYAKISYGHFVILSSTSTFQIWSSRYFCTTTYLNIPLKILPSVWRCQQMHIIQLHAKTQCCYLKNLSESTSFSFWSSLVICTATLFYFTLVPMSFFLLVALPTKPLSPGEWTHWRILSACNETIFLLSKTGVWQNLH